MSDAPIHPAALPVDTLLVDCDVTRTKRSGPGGQHRNKRETAVVVTHRPTGVRGEASERRSQPRNEAEAVRRLRIELAKSVRIDEPYNPTALWRKRCKGSASGGGRIVVSVEHDDFPAVLAEVLDAIGRCAFDVAAAGEHLGCSTAQLVKLLRNVPDALERINAVRTGELGLPKLR